MLPTPSSGGYCHGNPLRWWCTMICILRGMSKVHLFWYKRCTISHVWKNKVHICNIVNLCFSLVNCVPPPDGSIWYWSPSSSSSVSMVELLRLDSWHFRLPFRLGVSSSLPNTLFCFFLCPSLSWSFVSAFLCVCHQHSHWLNQHEMIY
jgi:hypothetical protein